jgi:amidase
MSVLPEHRPEADRPGLDRRTFLEYGTLGLAGAAIAGTACRVAEAPTSEPPGQDGAPLRPEDTFELREATLETLQAGLHYGRWTSQRLVELYLERIATLDRTGPALRSVIEVNPEADRIAAGLDAERKQGRLRSPLHGIPILIKDNIDTADAMKTTAGSLALADCIAPRDAFVVERLRAAGAIILGKTNLSEWANFRSSRSTSGWSARGGQCRNPYVVDRNPCGSSSGSGAAVAANLALMAVGTETDGSILCPSHSCGLVGVKPTVGLVSRAGIIPIAASQDTAGPMARTVTDAAALLSAINGIDRRDPATEASRPHLQSDFRQFLDVNGLKGAPSGSTPPSTRSSKTHSTSCGARARR